MFKTDTIRAKKYTELTSVNDLLFNHNRLKKKMFSGNNAVINVRMLLKNTIGQPGLSLADRLTRTAMLLLTGCQLMLLVVASVW